VFLDDGVDGVSTVSANAAWYCAILAAGEELLTTRARVVKPHVPELAPGAPSFEPLEAWTLGLREPTIDWDPEGGAFLGAGLDSSGQVVLFEADPACSSWRRTGPLLEVGPATSVLGLQIDADRTRWLYTWRTGDAQVTRWRAEPSGSFELALPPLPWNTRTGPGPRRPDVLVLRVELQQFFVRSDAYLGQLAIALEDAGNRSPFFASSARHGTFDAAMIDHGVLWVPSFEASRGSFWWSLAVYAARACADCPRRVGFAWFTPGGRVIVP
jgi:hypothetical protein